MIERLRVLVPAGAAGEISSPELTLCADFYSVSFPPPCYRSGTYEIPGHSTISADGRLHLNTHTFLTQQGRTWEMRRKGFLNRPGSRGCVSPWLGAGTMALLGDEHPPTPHPHLQTLQNSSILYDKFVASPGLL